MMEDKNDEELAVRIMSSTYSNRYVVSVLLWRMNRDESALEA